MKCTIPEISWHNREPVLSLHIQPVSEKFYRLATGGADCHVLIWQLIINENGAVKIEALSDLTRHQRAVNSVRWAPGGQYLATADDDANIIIWQRKTDNIPLLDGETNDKETWIVHKVMRGHKEDIYDLCWSPNGLKLLSGSIDNTAILWDVLKGKSGHILRDHKGFVQGVAWDPKGHYIATISTDKICRIFDSSGKQVKARIQKGFLPVARDHYLYNKDVKYFHDDTFKSFFRRLDFSPDGTLLAVPSGHFEIEDCKKSLNATLIFAIDSWSTPIAVLPCGKQSSTVARFCPLLFDLHEDRQEPVILLPFRMILAVGTDHDIILYDTQQVAPFAYFKDIHYTRLTDLTWSDDGLLLVASSTDGYCALITFELEELGTQYVKEESEVEETVLDISGCEELEKEEDVETPQHTKKKNFLEQWTIKAPKRTEDQNVFGSRNIDDTENDVIIVESNPEFSKRRSVEPNNEVVQKKIKLTVESKKTKNHVCEVSKIKPFPAVDNNDTPQVKRRIKPVLVVDEKLANVKRESSCKDSPLSSFIKKFSTKEKLDESRKTKDRIGAAPPPGVILDEIEARDAWKCEKDEIEIIEPKTSNYEEHTEEFSLHLDNTCSTTQHQINVDVKEDNKLTKEQNNDAKEEKQSIESYVEKEETLNQKNHIETSREEVKITKETCVHADSDIKGLDSEKHLNARSVSNTEDRPKRRIPLITLASPKHKKK